jgi:hypothetical protein
MKILVLNTTLVMGLLHLRELQTRYLRSQKDSLRIRLLIFPISISLRLEQKNMIRSQSKSLIQLQTMLLL